MPADFVAAGVALPNPLTVAARAPAVFDSFEPWVFDLLGSHLLRREGAVAVGHPVPIAGNDRAGHESGRVRDGLQEFHGSITLAGILGRFRITRYGVAERFGAHVQARKQSVVVGIRGSVAR